MPVIGTLSLTDIYRPIKSDLERFNAMVQEELSSKDPFIQSVHNHLLLISGKHLRPALAIMSARLCGEKSDVPIRMAIAIELLHTATLIHDDIIDGSMYRRNQLSMNAKWGIEVSIICGDYLYAKAFSILSQLGDANINKMFSLCARTMCEGELKQVETRNSLQMSEDSYTEIILKKTASLFQAACAVGAYSAKQPIPTVTLLGEYGKNFGLAFQIVDDCLDIIGKEESLGKKNGADFEKKDPTLPLIYLYQALDPARREELARLMNAGAPEEMASNFEKIKQLSVGTGAMEKCMQRARDYARTASDSLKGLPDSVYRKSLSDLVDFTLQRI